jgi:excisionase family DNA binding protein
MSARTDSKRDVITVAEAARRVGLCRQTITKAIKAGEFPGYAIGNKYVIPVEWFERWLKGEKS